MEVWDREKSRGGDCEAKRFRAGDSDAGVRGSSGGAGAASEEIEWREQRKQRCGGARQGSVREKMRDLPLCGQRRQENWTGTKRLEQARDVYREQQQGDRRKPEDVDRKRRFANAGIERFAGDGADQGRDRLREDTVRASRLASNALRESPRRLDGSSRRGPKFNEAPAAT